MRVTVIILVSLAVMATLTPVAVKLWPRSYTQDFVLLWLNKGDWIDLLELAEKTPYTHITWIDSELIQAGTRTKNGIHWEEKPEISELISAARDYGIYSFDFQYYRGNWGITGLGDVWVKSSNQEEIISVNSYYQYGGKLDGKRCSTKLIEAESAGRCHKRLFGGWILYKEWITTPNPFYGLNEQT